MDCRLLQGNLKNVIKDSLAGVTCINQEVTLLDFGNVIVRKDYIGDECVRIVSGGSHFFGDFVGKGMLTAAVQGENFMAPPSKEILRTIRELSLKHIKGVLIIVPATSGVLLNFGLATERAINDNIRIKLLPINEDCNKNIPKLCRIGLSGVILVTKIAGALSEKGNSLSDSFKYCEQVVQNLSSSAVILKNLKEGDEIECICKNKKSSPDEPKPKKPKILDIGYDICRVAVQDIIGVSTALSKSDKLSLKPEDSIVVLLNNNNGLSKTEEFIFIKEFMNILQPMGVTVRRFYIGNFFKCSRSINMTVTILKVFDEEVLGYLDYPCSAPGWKTVNQGVEALKLETPISGKLRRKDRLAPPIRGPKLSNRLANILLFCTQFACDALISCEKQLNTIDSERGDGDAGTRLKNACEVLMKRMKDNKVLVHHPFTFLESLSKLLEATVGGCMGCIYSILFEASASSFGEHEEGDEVTPFMWLESLERATEALKTYGNVGFDEGTMYDPLFSCSKAIRDELEKGRHYIEAFGKGVSSAEEAAERTRKARLKYPDSGAHAVGIWMRATYEGVKLMLPID